MADEKEARKVVVTGLQNAHAMEKQALSMMQPQINRLRKYDELRQRLREHVGETNEQIKRLEEALGALKARPSPLKDAMQSTAGSVAALGHVVTGDEALKDTFANLAFENYEIAAYESLLSAGKEADVEEVLAPLKESLSEEERMAAWVREHIPAVTSTFISLRAGPGSAKR